MKKLIDQYEIISFDIFDTLLLRDFYYPIDVFKYIEEKYNIKDFQKRRIEAEVECRNLNTGSEEICYKDIYALLSDVDPAIELAAELECCLPNPEMKREYDRAVSLGKKIISISDMYLDEQFIRKLLMKCGYTDVSKIYVSNAYGLRKSSGNLYRYVLDDLHIDSSELLHIGDNYASDYRKAQELGIRSFYYPTKREQLKNNKNSVFLNNLQNSENLADSIYGALISNQYELNHEAEYWERFGYEYAGIVIYQFVEWVLKYCREHDLNRLFFMARDGEIMKKVFDYLHPDAAIETYYIEASRRTFLLASISVLDENSLDYLTSGAPDSTLMSFIERLELKELRQYAQEYFGDLDIKINNNTERDRLKAFFKANENYILKRAFSERKNLLSYLSENAFTDHENSAIVDIGWNATSQKYLEKILGIQMHGLYFGTKKSTYQHDKIHGFYFDRGNPKQRAELIEQNLEIAELLFLGTHASVVRIDENNSVVYFPVVKEEEERISKAHDIQLGVMKFTEDYSRQLKKYNALPSIELIDYMMENLLVKPGLADIEHIGRLSYATGFGNSSYRRILQNLNLTYRDFFVNLLLRKSEKNFNYWHNGWMEYQKLQNSKYMFIMNKLVWFNGKIRRCRFHGLKLCLKKIVMKFRDKVWK